MSRATIAWALGCLALLLASPAHAIDGDRYGEVRLFTPAGEQRGTVLMFSDRAGWSAADQLTATMLAASGALVAGVDRRYYLNRLDEVDKACHVLIGDAEALARYIQRLHGSQGYQLPILFGVGVGGGLADATLQQARANTIAGAATLDVRLDLGMAAPPCTDTGKMTVDSLVAGGGPGPLQGFWIAASRPDGSDVDRQAVARWAASGVAVERRDLLAGTTEAGAALALVVPHLHESVPAAAAAAAAAAASVSDLPLVELPAPQPTDRVAIVLSGDGGWRDIDKTVAEDLQSNGISVVGWDSLRYFWHSKTPDRVAHDLAMVMRYYIGHWGARHVVLVGYSFGADVLPFAFNRLPTDLREKVSLMSLLAFSKSADFEISVTGWLGAPSTDAALPVASEIGQVPHGLVQCFYGQGEDDSECPALAAQGFEVIRTGGGHHFDGDYGALTQKIIAGLTRRAG